jgi:hypothetical protein
MESVKRKRKQRSKVSHPNLDYKYTIPSRHEFLDCRHYVNGVKGTDGELAIRPLNESELTWLNDFYAGDLNASFTEQNEYIFKMSDEDTLKYENMRSQLTKVRVELKRVKARKVVNTDTLRELYAQMNVLKDELNALNKKVGSYQRNNWRNNDLFIKIKLNGKVVPLEEWTKMEDSDEDDDLK